MDLTLVPIGSVRSKLTEKFQAPRQEFLGAPQAEIHILERYAPALNGVKAGQQILVLTWFHKSDRDALDTHPQGNPAIPRRGIFATRSPNRPNPIGLHQVTILDIKGSVLTVDALEALDGTPVIDLKPVIHRERETGGK